MSVNARSIAIATVCLFASQAQFSLAAGAGHGHSGGPAHAHQGGNDHHQSQLNQNALPSYANSWPYLRAENGIFGPVWAAPGPGTPVGGIGGVGGGGVGCGGGGYGSGGDYGMSFDYDIAPPYFDFFPPVYYSYNKGAVSPSANQNAPRRALPIPRVKRLTCRPVSRARR